MQHAGLQYGQGAANSHQSPPFAHADIPQTAGGTTTSSLRQFRKKDGAEKTSDLNTSIENSHIARVAPHSHYPPKPNDYYRYQHQYPDYNSPFKEPPAQVKYSEIAETPHNVDLQKHKEPHKEFMDMCNISQQTHMKQNYPDNLTRQQSYPPDASVHHQYLHKEPQVHPTYKPESQYQQYPQLPKYNMPSQCRKYPPPPPPENDFLAKLQRINPSMARSIMSDHHIRESQSYSMDQNRMYPQNQRYYPPAHLQNNLSYNYQPYNYPSCNYKHPEYPRPQMPVGGGQYPAINPHSDRSISPRNLHMMNYGTSQKISPNYSQYNPPEYAQHYQHRRATIPQEYYQQNCRASSYMPGHEIPPEPTDNRASSGVLRHFIENWAEEEGTSEIAPQIFKENIRIHNNESTNEVFFINSSDNPLCLENTHVSLVPTENGQYIIKAATVENPKVKETESTADKIVNLQIVEATPKSDCMLEEAEKIAEEVPAVPYPLENQNEKDCDETKTSQVEEPKEAEPEPEKETEEEEEEKRQESTETSVIVSNEVSVIKDMPLIDEEARNEEEKEETPLESPNEETNDEPEKESSEETPQVEEIQEDKEVPEENQVDSASKRRQRIFSVDDIINNIGSSPTESRRNSLQFVPKTTDEETNEESPSNENPEENEEMEYRNAISVEDDNVILEIGGVWVQLNINCLNGTKVLSVVPLSESLVIDVNGNYQDGEERNLVGSEENEEKSQSEESVQLDAEKTDLSVKSVEESLQNLESIEANLQNMDTIEENLRSLESVEENLQNMDKIEENLECDVPIEKNEDVPPQESAPSGSLEDINSGVCQNEVVIGEDTNDDVFLELHIETDLKETLEVPEEEEEEEEIIKPRIIEPSRRRDEKRKSRDGEDRRKSTKKLKTEERRDSEERAKQKKVPKDEVLRKSRSETQKMSDVKRDGSEELKKKDLNVKKQEKKFASPIGVNEKERDGSEERKKILISKKEKKFGSQSSVNEEERDGSEERKKNLLSKKEKKFGSQSSVNEEDRDGSEERKKNLLQKKHEKKLASQSSVNDEERDGSEERKKNLLSKKYERKFGSQSSVNSEERDGSEERKRKDWKKSERKLAPRNNSEERDESEERKKKDSSKQEKKLIDEDKRKEEMGKLKKEKRLTPQNSFEESESKKNEESVKSKKIDKKLTAQVSVIVEDEVKKREIEDLKVKKQEKKIVEEQPKEIKPKKQEKKEEEPIQKEIKTKKLNTNQKEVKMKKEKKTVPIVTVPEVTQEKENEETARVTTIVEEIVERPPEPVEEPKEDPKPTETKTEDHEEKPEETVKENVPSPDSDVIKLAEEMIAKKQLEESKELQTKASKKLYINEPPALIQVPQEPKSKKEETMKQKSKLEEAVNKIKSLKERSVKEEVKVRKTSMKDYERKSPKVAKKVTFNLETEVREISKEELDRKRLSWEEYSSRKRRNSPDSHPEETRITIMENTVTSTEDVVEEVVEQPEVESEVQEIARSPPPPLGSNNWEEDSPSPESPPKNEVILTNRKCVIDVNEFNIKPIESVSTPSPVSSSQFSYSEDDSLQVYKDVVHSKLNSLNINIPKVTKPKPVDRFSVLLDRFLNKGTLNYEELEEVKKFIEIKRKMMEEEKKLTYEVRGERDYKDLKLHFRKVPGKRKKKRFRNLYTETSSDSDSSRSEQGVGDYSVYQRDSQGVPKLIFKRKSGLPQPFVKLERSQAVELLAKKRKLY